MLTSEAKASELLTMMTGQNLLDYFHKGCNERIAYNLYTQQFYCTGGCARKWPIDWIKDQAKKEKSKVAYDGPVPTEIYRCIDA